MNGCLVAIGGGLASKVIDVVDITQAQGKTFRVVGYKMEGEIRCAVEIHEVDKVSTVWGLIDSFGRPHTTVNGAIIEYSGMRSLINEVCLRMLKG